MTRKVKIEDMGEWNGSYRDRTSSPSTPKRVTRSSAKRRPEEANLQERASHSSKKQKKALDPVSVHDEEDQLKKHVDLTGDSTDGTEDDDDSDNEGDESDDDEQMVQDQLVSLQKEQREIEAKKAKQQMKERDDKQRQEQARIEGLEKLRKEKLAQNRERHELLEKKHEYNKRRRQENLEMYRVAKERMDKEQLEKETKELREKERLEMVCRGIEVVRKEAEEQRVLQLAQEQKAQDKRSVAKRLRDEEEDDNDSDEDEEDDTDDEDDDGDDGDDGDDDEEDSGEDEGEEGGEGKNALPGAEVPDLANRQPKYLYTCIRCVKELAVSSVYSCNITDNLHKCARCTQRGRSCKPVPDVVHGAVSKLLALQKQYDAADPKSREVLRIRVLSEAAAIVEQVRSAKSHRRKTRDETYRAILFGQVGIKHNQEEILKLLRLLLSRRSAEGNGPIVSGRVSKGKGRA